VVCYLACVRLLLLILICCMSVHAKEGGHLIDDPDLGFTLRIPSGWAFVPEEDVDEYEAGLRSKSPDRYATTLYCLSPSGTLEDERFVDVQVLALSLSHVPMTHIAETFNALTLEEASAQLGRSANAVEASVALDRPVLDEKRGAIFMNTIGETPSGKPLEGMFCMFVGDKHFIGVSVRLRPGAPDLDQVVTTFVDGFEWHDGFAHVPPESLGRRLLIAALIGAGVGSLVVMARFFVKRRAASRSA